MKHNPRCLHRIMNTTQVPSGWIRCFHRCSGKKEKINSSMMVLLTPIFSGDILQVCKELTNQAAESEADAQHRDRVSCVTMSQDFGCALNHMLLSTGSYTIAINADKDSSTSTCKIGRSIAMRNSPFGADFDCVDSNQSQTKVPVASPAHTRGAGCTLSLCHM
jgi:hypothetical protein